MCLELFGRPSKATHRNRGKLFVKKIIDAWIRGFRLRPRRRSATFAFVIRFAFLLLALTRLLHADGFEPRGRIHAPIGLPDSRDTLKTFVEAEGNFSPGFGSCGVAFWIHDHASRRFFAPTMDDVPHTRGLREPGVLIPWTQWQIGRAHV